MTRIYEYHSIIRADAISLISDLKFENALEIGCGTGNTLGFLKDKKIISNATGLELNPECYKYKNPSVDSFYIGNAETFDFSSKQYDLILLLDVIEHLKEPWDFLKKINERLNQKGTLVISIPNINNLRILKHLIINDCWDYSDAGILDQTHLRFFTLTSFLNQMSEQLPKLSNKKIIKKNEDIRFWLFRQVSG